MDEFIQVEAHRVKYHRKHRPKPPPYTIVNNSPPLSTWDLLTVLVCVAVVPAIVATARMLLK